MPTNRRKIRPVRIGGDWAEQYLLSGEPPDESDPDFDEFFGWCFLGQPVRGLPTLVDRKSLAELRAVQREVRRRAGVRGGPIVSPWGR